MDSFQNVKQNTNKVFSKGYCLPAGKPGKERGHAHHIHVLSGPNKDRMTINAPPGDRKKKILHFFVAFFFGVISIVRLSAGNWSN